MVQTPGLLERIMQDWRGMLRSFMGNIMNYISPSTKEPKDGFAAQDRTAVMVRRMVHRAMRYVDSFLA
ncbi:hypothetical protein Hamer_G012644 [Homarus americanus]|uniref:Uncharacterized protein n=1 Tax=Homarus americanus TaxID=6706 RepID=A0A8J5JPV7_HOMAM|nr:hypothetical protein Hamer_G012644 [Homarus americanus]